MRVLVVEDQPDVQAAICRTLREEGYAVDEASDGEEGLAKAMAWQYDAIVLDLMIPKLGGLELLSRLRRRHATPVLILSARDHLNDRIKGLDTGADDYLVKPFSLEELLARLRSLIRRSAGQPDPIIRIGPIEIDTRARSIKKENQAVELTAMEYNLVELLARNRGGLVTREKIYEHIFDENDDSLSNVVEVHVLHIRKKLGREFITTKRGQGYLIDG
jgi:two-component system OmpR family response regulator